MDISNPKCPKCNGDSAVIGNTKYSCHECNHEWPMGNRKVTRKKDKDTSTSEDVQVAVSGPDGMAQHIQDATFEGYDDLAEPQPAEPEPEPEAEPTPVKTALVLSAAQAQLESLYEQINAKLFGGKLPSSVVITIQSKGRKQAVAWYADARWETGKLGVNPEINFCAEHLRDGREEIVERMIHEMVHAMNARDEIKDCGKSGRYHNMKFKHAAEAVGLIVEKSETCGHSTTSLGPRLKDICTQVNLRDEAFALVRKEREGKGKTGTRLVKWTCGCRNFWMKTDGEGINCELCGNKFAMGA